MLEAVKKESETYLDRFASQMRADEGRAPAWLARLKKAAIARFEVLGFPTTRHEDWKYTNLSQLSKSSFRSAAAVAEPGISGLEAIAFAELDCPRITFVNGRYEARLSTLSNLPEGVEVLPLSEALQSRQDVVEAHLARYADYQDHVFSALNTAFVEEGAFIRIPDHLVLENPIHFLYIVSGADSLVTHPRNLVLVGADSQVKIIEGYASTDSEGHFTNAVTEIALDQAAVVDHVKLQTETQSAFHISRTQIRQERDSSYSNHNIVLGAALARNNIHDVMEGEGCSCTLNGVYIVGGRQHVDNFTVMEHAKPHCGSREHYKGILDGKAKGVFHGRIIVRKDAQKTDSEQTNNNLLLSDNALVNTKPQLEIYADDVKCTHGATIGQLEEEQLFYMRARGIPEKAARGMLIYAFAAEVIDKVGFSPIRQKMREYLADWLPYGCPVEEIDL